jgi:hypothetical protein
MLLRVDNLGSVYQSTPYPHPCRQQANDLGLNKREWVGQQLLRYHCINGQVAFPQHIYVPYEIGSHTD